MGIFAVLAFWSGIGLVIAVVAAFFAHRIVSHMVRVDKDLSKERARKRAIRWATVLPFACLVWAAAVFGFQGFVNTAFLHRDIGLGDSFYCPLPNGYSIFMFDVSDRGTIYNPKTQLLIDSLRDRRGAVSGVRDLQVAGPVILGAFDSRYAQHWYLPDVHPDRYFLLDTHSGVRVDYETLGALRVAAGTRGIDVKLEPIFTVYRRYRVTDFDIFAVCLLWIPPLIVLLLLLRYVVRLRRSQIAPGQNGHQPVHV